MEGQYFDMLTRTLTASRRSLVIGGLALVLGRSDLPSAEAKKGHRKKRKKRSQRAAPSTPPPPPAFNAFGCLDVGQPCQGDNSLCCSGICDPGTSTCVGHNAGPCVPAADSCTVGAEVPCNASNRFSVCTLTTGNAAFCGDITGGTTTHCRVCRKDTDCQAEFGAGAACVVLGGGCSPLCGITGRTACLAAGI
jgi:hypothetical protein